MLPTTGASEEGGAAQQQQQASLQQLRKHAAEALLREAADGFRRVLGPSHPNTRAAASHFAALQRARGNSFDFWRPASLLSKYDNAAMALLEDVGLTEYASLSAGQLPYGRKRALEMATTLAMQPAMMLLDEPTAGMNNTETERFIGLIKEVTLGKTLLAVEHDMGVVFGLADKIAVLVYGQIIAFDTPDKVRANARVQEAYLGSLTESH
jgi:ABC-type branched-subunit amino acid transport system ATPase component